MEQHLLAIALGVAAASACSIAPAQTPPISASDEVCVLVRLAERSANTSLSREDSQKVWAIETTPLPRPSVRCGETTYQTDPEQRGLTYMAVGFSDDRAFARLEYQSVSDPLAGAGFSCLYEAGARGWALRGCTNDWIS